ncbi:hypothetical protein BDR06DRAFT_899476, partial [Suillus hirtellus]
QHPVFQKPLKKSLRYPSVQILTTASCTCVGVSDVNIDLNVQHHQLQKVEGTFGVNGSNQHYEVQLMYYFRHRYGKSLDWKNEHFTSHGVASVFRRYLMPISDVPRSLLRTQARAGMKLFNHDKLIATYKRPIQRMPRANQYLLLYILDLLSVFARKSDDSHKYAKILYLAVIFRPGLISHPSHEMSPGEHALDSIRRRSLCRQTSMSTTRQPP